MAEASGLNSPETGVAAPAGGSTPSADEENAIALLRRGMALIDAHRQKMAEGRGEMERPTLTLPAGLLDDDLAGLFNVSSCWDYRAFLLCLQILRESKKTIGTAPATPVVSVASAGEVPK